MSVAKVSLSLDDSLLGEARRIAGRRGLSRYMTRALRNQLQHDRLAGLLATLEAEAGPVDSSVMEEVRASWPASDERPTRQDG